MTTDNARQAGLREAADYIASKADDYANRFGFGIAGSLSFGSQVKMDHFTSLCELAEELRALAAQSADASNAATGRGLTPEELKSAKYLNEISGPGFMHRQNLAPINAFVQRLLDAPAAPASEDDIAAVSRRISRALMGDERKVDCDIIASHIRGLLHDAAPATAQAEAHE